MELQNKALRKVVHSNKMGQIKNLIVLKSLVHM